MGRALRQSVQALLAREGAANEACRGGSGDAPSTQIACAKRDRLDGQLQAKGWCYGEGASSGADAVWAPCGRPANVTGETIQRSTASSQPQVDHVAFGAGIGVGLGLLILYFTPTLVALKRAHRQKAAIGILNLFLRWTVLG